MVDHHQKASKPRTPPESQPLIGLTGASLFYQTCFFFCERSRCGRHMLQPAARCRVAVPLAAPDSSNRVACARHCGRGLAPT